MRKRKLRLKRPLKRFLNLFRNPFFWALTITGNGVMLGGSFLLWMFESEREVPLGILDCVLWSVGTVTTVGYGDWAAHTTTGKLVILALMLFGTVFVWSYMAFLVTGLIAPELAALERDVHDVELEVRGLKGETPREKV